MYENNSRVNVTLLVVENDATAFHVDDKLGTSNIIVMAIVLAVIFVTSIFGNVSVFIIFYKRPSLVTLSNKFIVNLSICNVIETITVIPFAFAALVNQDWNFGSFWCQFTGFLMNTVFAASTLTLVAIAIDRYCAVVTPLHYSLKMTNNRAAVMIISVWLISILCSIPPLVGWNRYVFQRHKMACMPVSSSTNIHDLTFIMFLVTLCFILPLIVILWAYSVIFRAARHNIEKVRRNSTVTIGTGVADVAELPLRINSRRGSSAQVLIHRLSISNRSNSLLWRRDEWKTAVTSFMVLFTFMLCWMLYFIVIILESILRDPRCIDAPMKTLSVLLAMSSCALNPLVYVFRSKIQRTELKSLVGIKPSTQNNTISGSRRASAAFARGSPCITREGSQESEVEILHHVNTTTTLTSMVSGDTSQDIVVKN